MSIETVEQVKIGMGATHCGYSDKTPFEVIAKTRCTVTVREMSAAFAPEFTPEYSVGEFGAGCTNQADQKWVLKSDGNGLQDVLRLTKRGWHGQRGLYVIGRAVKFLDYNF